MAQILHAVLNQHCPDFGNSPSTRASRAFGITDPVRADLSQRLARTYPRVPIGCRSPRKRGPYSMPIHTKRASSTTSAGDYIADVLDKLVNLWPASRIDELMPWAWAKRGPHPIASPPDPQRQLTKAVGRKRRLRWPIVSERWSESNRNPRPPRIAHSLKMSGCAEGPVKVQNRRSMCPVRPSQKPRRHASRCRRRLTGWKMKFLGKNKPLRMLRKTQRRRIGRHWYSQK